MTPQSITGLAEMDESLEWFSYTLWRFIRDADGKQGDYSNCLRELKEFLNRRFSFCSPDPDPTSPQPQTAGRKGHILRGRCPGFNRMKRVDPTIHADQNDHRGFLDPQVEDTLPGCFVT